MVAVPNIGKVAVPDKIPPTVSVAVTADEVPCAVTLNMAEGEKLAGILSTKVALVAVFRPAFVITSEKVTV